MNNNLNNNYNVFTSSWSLLLFFSLSSLFFFFLQKVAYRPVDGIRGAPDICLVEVGGTVGDIESMVFLEALRQFQFRVKRENISFVHVSLVPSLSSVGEQKTKPTQHGVKQLMMAGEYLIFFSIHNRFVIIHCCFVWTDVLIFF